MGAAALTFLIWLVFGPDPAQTFVLVNAVAVLLIACACAMGLAMPTFIMELTGRSFGMGVLFGRDESLQTLRSVNGVGSTRPAP